jgi:hypothetical protein
MSRNRSTAARPSLAADADTRTNLPARADPLDLSRAAAAVAGYVRLSDVGVLPIAERLQAVLAGQVAVDPAKRARRLSDMTMSQLLA